MRCRFSSGVGNQRYRDLGDILATMSSRSHINKMTSERQHVCYLNGQHDVAETAVPGPGDEDADTTAYSG